MKIAKSGWLQNLDSGRKRGSNAKSAPKMTSRAIAARAIHRRTRNGVLVLNSPDAKHQLPANRPGFWRAAACDRKQARPDRQAFL